MSKMGVGRCCCGKFVYVTANGGSSRLAKITGLASQTYSYVDDPDGIQFGSSKIAVDYSNSEVFLSKFGTSLYKVTPDYKNPEFLYTQPSGYNIIAQCADYVNRRVYFTTAGGGDMKIWRIDHDGANIVDLYTCPVFSGAQKWQVAHVVCRPEEGKLFWSEGAYNTATTKSEWRIRVADLDAVGPTDIYYTAGAFTDTINDLDADHDNNRIWFCSQIFSRPAAPFYDPPLIQYCNLDGTGLTTWKTAVDANAKNHQFKSIEVSQLSGRIYYSVWTYTGAQMDDGDGWYSDTFAQDDLTFISDEDAGGIDGTNNEIDLGKGYERFG